MEPGFLGDLCGLLLPLWVGDAGAWGRDAALWRGNQVTTLTDGPLVLCHHTAEVGALSLRGPRSRPQTRSIQEKIMQVSHRYPKTSALRRNRTVRAPARL